MKLHVWIAVAVLLTVLPATAQTAGKPAPQTPEQRRQETNADSGLAMPPQPLQSKKELTASAWQLLEDALADPKHPEVRTQSLAALGSMGSNPRVREMIAKAFLDPDVDVRTAAVLAAGQTKNRALVPALHGLLDDKEPQVAFAAASTLWKMGDRSGQDLLEAVVDGEQQGNAGMMHGSMHAASRTLHDPAAMAKFGAIEGAQFLLGPFGLGISAFEYMKHNGGGSSARVAAIEELTGLKSPGIRGALLDAVTDKDPAVRAAAAKALHGYHDAEVNGALAMLLQDPKKPVQLAGAAAYLISVGAVAVPL